MHIKVLYFAQLAEKLGRDEQAFEIEEGLTVGQLLQRIQKDWADPDLKQLPLLKAVNENYCDDAAFLKPGDLVAFLPPVAGG